MPKSHLTLSLELKNADATQLELECAGLGIEVTSQGLATASARISIDRFVRLFSVEPQYVQAKPPDDNSAGSTGRYQVDKTLEVPESLKDLVLTIELEPALTLFERETNCGTDSSR